jgi:hypothetical protein
MLNFLRHLFLPHQTNNHKPKVLHHSSFVSYILLALAVQLVFQIVLVTKPAVLGLATDITADRILTLVNDQRIQNGLAPVKMDSELSQGAALKANDMFAKNYWAHFAPDGTSPWDFFSQAGYHYLYAGENLARDFATSDQVVLAWMNSPTHRANILNGKYQEMGLAIVNGKLGDDETTLIVEFFGTKQGTVPKVSSAQTQQPQQQAVQITVTPAVPVLAKLPVILPQEKLVAGANTNTLAVSTKPLFDIFKVTKDFSYAIVAFLLLVLAVDAYMVKKHKIIRASGNNFAHMALLVFLLFAIYITHGGAIL